jgi:signal transduction histidine kinase
VGLRRSPRNTGAELPLERFFGGISPFLGVTIGVCFIGVVATIDHFTGSEIVLAALFLMPVMLVTWNAGRLAGVVMAGIAAVAAQAADIIDGEAGVPSWNAVVWLCVFMLTVWLLSSLKESMRRQGARIGERLAEEEVVADDLRQQNDLKNTLLHAVAHDLKGPLAGILGAMQTIRRAGDLGLTDAEMEDLYGVIEQAGAKAARLIDDLLDLERMGRGQLTIDREPTDVVQIARRSAEELPTLAGHPVRVDGPEVRVEVDGPKVERIVENLLNNAARHTTVGTPIHVDVQPLSDGVDLIVEDEGPGVPDDVKAAIFQPFTQGQAARGGVGIGLSLVQRFAELHGGSAHVEDRPGGGARFVVRLPGRVRTAQPALRAV